MCQEEPFVRFGQGHSVEQFGRYRLESMIGRGGMGEVYRAYDTEHGRTVALKRLRAGLDPGGDYEARFRRESRLAARLASPHVIPIHDFGEIDGQLFIDMRLVTGQDLAAVIEDGPLDPARAVAVVVQIADALEAAHADDLVHRDVKPSNVLLTDMRGRDFVYLVDFGIARAVGPDARSSLTATGTAIGTMTYMAPELFSGGDIDRRVDVYALTCLLYETLTGAPPFTAEGPALMYQHLVAEPPRPSAARPELPPGLDAVVARGMAKDREDRYATAAEFADAAAAALGSATSARAPTPITSPAPEPPGAGSAHEPPIPDASAPEPPEPRTPPASVGEQVAAPETRESPVRPVAVGGPVAAPETRESPVPPTVPDGVGEPERRSRRRPRAVVPAVAGAVALLAVATAAWLLAGSGGSPESVPPAALGSSEPESPELGQLRQAFPEIRNRGPACRSLRPGAPTAAVVVATGVRPRIEVGCDIDGGSVRFVLWPSPADARAYFAQAAESETREAGTPPNWTLRDKYQGDLFVSGTSPLVIADYADRAFTYYAVGTDTTAVRRAFDAVAVSDVDSLPG